MTANFQWSVTSLQCYPEQDGLSDVVFQVGWLCTASQEANGFLYEANTQGLASVSLSPDEPYTPYSQLTEAQIIGWILPLIQTNVTEPESTATLQEKTEASLQAQIDLQINPPVVSPPLPWIQE